MVEEAGFVQVEVPWGRQSVTVEIAPSRVGGILGAKVQPAADPDGVLRAALAGAATDPAAPTASLEAFLAAAEPPLAIVVNDGTRPTPSATVLQQLEPHLAGWRARHGDRVTLLVATGTHRAPLPDELERVLGPGVFADYASRVFSHDARETQSLVAVGVTGRGTPVYLNRLLVEARSVILINSVEPHYFAGYTGGRKSVFPGLAGYESIRANHRWAMEPGAEALRLAGNPVHEDLEEATALGLAGKQVYSVQLVLDQDHRVGFATAGELGTTFARAVAVAEEQFVLDLDRQYEVVVAAAPYPMDCDFYQTNKAIQSGALAVKDGGILIVVSECRFGLGENRVLYERLAASSCPSGVRSQSQQEYCLGFQQPARIASILERIQVWVVSALDPGLVRDMFMTPFSSIREAVEAALASQGPEAQVLFLKQASITVPRVLV